MKKIYIKFNGEEEWKNLIPYMMSLGYTRPEQSVFLRYDDSENLMIGFDDGGFMPSSTYLHSENELKVNGFEELIITKS